MQITDKIELHLCNNIDLMNNIKEKLADYSVEDLKSVLGAKLAEQVLVEETTDEEKTNGLIYSFNGVAKKETEIKQKLAQVTNKKDKDMAYAKSV